MRIPQHETNQATKYPTSVQRIRDLMLAAPDEELPQLLSMAAVDAIEARDLYHAALAAAIGIIHDKDTEIVRLRQRNTAMASELREVRQPAREAA